MNWHCDSQYRLRNPIASSPTELSRRHAAEAVPIHTVPVGEHARILHATGCVATITDWYTFAHAPPDPNQKAMSLLVVRRKVLILQQGDRATMSHNSPCPPSNSGNGQSSAGEPTL